MKIKEHRVLVDCSEDLIQKCLGCSIEVHRQLGPGLLESVYELALIYEIKSTGMDVVNQKEVCIVYKDQKLGVGFRADIIVENSLLLELKVVEKVNGIHLAQVMTYLKLLNIKRGFILNFNTKLLRDGIKRVSI